MEDITDGDYTEVKRVYKDFKVKNLGKHYEKYQRNVISFNWYDMLLMVEKCITGGTCCAIYRNLKANSK